MENIFNIRTLAKGLRNRNGYMIFDDLIFRSGDISHASEKDLESLEKIQIKTVYDLRSRIEKDIYLTGYSFKVKHIEIFKESRQNDFRKLLGMSKNHNEQFMLNLYGVEFVKSKKFCVLLKEIISREDKAFLFHCTAGKDRTGILGAILMMIFDFDIKSIEKEYLRIDRDMTHIFTRKISVMLGSGSDEIPRNLEPLLLVKASYIGAFISSITSEYGDIDNYIRIGLGVSDKEKDLLKVRYLNLNESESKGAE